jgi:hypothetical protein
MIEIVLILVGLLSLGLIYYATSSRMTAKKLNQLDNITDCLSQRNTLMFGVNGEQNLSKANCIKGKSYLDFIKNFILGFNSQDIKDCVNDDKNDRVMFNIEGKKHCFSPKDSETIIQNIILGGNSKDIKDCINDEQNFRIMSNSAGLKECFSPEDSQTIAFDFLLGNGVRNCVANGNVLVQDGMYLFCKETPSVTPTPTPTPTI